MKRILAKQTSWNLFGFAPPALAAFACAPYLLLNLGAERFGFLSLIWVVFGIMGFLDVGLGRALIIVVAQLNGKKASDEIAANIATARFVVLVLSALISIISLIVISFIFLPDDKFVSQFELAVCAVLVAFGLYPNLEAAILRGSLEGFSDFKSSNVVRSIYGSAIFLVPAALAWIDFGIITITMSIIVSRLICNKLMRFFLEKHVNLDQIIFKKEIALSLIRTGGWVTISNVVGPLIVYLDRFVITYIISASAVAYYSLVADAISRILILPSSVAMSAFPYIAANQDQALLARRMIKQASLGSLMMLAPVSIVLFCFSEPLLTLWVGPEAAKNGAAVAKILAVAFSVNGMAQVPFSALQAMGQARAAALWHAGQLIPYYLLLYHLAREYGLEGAACAVLLRGLIDAAVMWFLLSKRLSQSTGKVAK